MKKTIISLFTCFLALVLLFSVCGFAAGEADLHAVYEEGISFWFGINGKEYNPEAARERFRTAAEGGYADAWYYLGNMALTGIDENRFASAMEYYEKGRELGSLLALYGMGRMYTAGRGVEVNYTKAKELYEEAVAGGCVEANEGLSEIYMYGHGVEQDGLAAIAYAEKALEGDDFQLVCRAMINIGRTYYYGYGVEQDYGKCMEWEMKAAEAGYNAAFGNIGNSYRLGKGVEKNEAEALAWYEKAAEKGSCDGLAWCYYNGVCVERDYGKAMELYIKALDSSVVSLGSGSNVAFWYIGHMYQLGLGTAQDYSSAMEWYEKGIADGNPDCMAQAAYMYRNGLGVEKNPDKAVELYEMAARNDSASAYESLGYMFEEGEGVAQNTEKAIAYFEKGAALGSSYCYGQLGWLYAYGKDKGVEPDLEKAKAFYEKGAELGSAYCHERLGIFYEEGKGVEKDPEKAAGYLLTAVQMSLEEQDQKLLERSVKALNRLGRTVDKIAINEKKVTLLAGGPAEAQAVQLTVSVTPDAALWKDAVWSSSDESIAVVDENGMVRGISAGKATITATTTQPLSDAKPAQVQVIVKQAVAAIEPENSEITVQVKKNVKIKAAVSPANAADKKLEWFSENPEIASVNASGQVTGKSAGTTTVTVKAKDGGGALAVIQITVIQPVKKIEAQQKSVTLQAGETCQLVWRVLPEDATDSSLSWSSGKESVATVDEDGLITAVSKGSCTITGTAKDGSKVKIQIKVTVK